MFGFGRKKTKEENGENLGEKDSVCPFCFKRVKANFVHFRLAEGEDSVDNLLFTYLKENIDEESSEEEATKKPFLEPDNLPVGYTASRNEKGIIKSITNGKITTQDKICPKCHNDLPDSFGEDKLITISLFGNTNSGKTVFLTKLGEHINNYLPTYLWSSNGGMPEITKKLHKNSEVLKNHILASTPLEAYEAPFIFRIANGEEKVLLAIFDAPGEATTESGLGKGIRLRQVENSDVIFTLLEPQDYLYNKNGEEEKVEASERNASLLNNLTNLTDGILKKEDSNQLKVKIAAILSKSDKIYEHPQIQENMKKNKIIFMDQKEYAPNDIKEVNEIVESFLKETQPANWSKLHNALHAQFFAVSSLGKDPEGKNVEEEHNSTRLLEPLFWAIHLKAPEILEPIQTKEE